MPSYSAARYLEDFEASSSHASSSKLMLDDVCQQQLTWSNPPYEQEELSEEDPWFDYEAWDAGSEPRYEQGRLPDLEHSSPLAAAGQDVAAMISCATGLPSPPLTVQSSPFSLPPVRESPPRTAGQLDASPLTFDVRGPPSPPLSSLDAGTPRSGNAVPLESPASSAAQDSRHASSSRHAQDMLPQLSPGSAGRWLPDVAPLLFTSGPSLVIPYDRAAYETSLQVPNALPAVLPSPFTIPVAGEASLTVLSWPAATEPQMGGKRKRDASDVGASSSAQRRSRGPRAPQTTSQARHTHGQREVMTCKCGEKGTSQELWDHVREKHGIEPLPVPAPREFRCGWMDCEYRAPNKDMAAHWNIAHKGHPADYVWAIEEGKAVRFHCRVCPDGQTSTVANGELVRHLKTVHWSLKKWCDNCGKWCRADVFDTAKRDHRRDCLKELMNSAKFAPSVDSEPCPLPTLE
ncbi:uncharacterized protein C8Q71DRAFT_859432 [Rhodofomes roseus]|uniref:C2H2-type domain-containing protein n=1 Tax=Rhodofomes roseus TaxID=34475 RepID=A0ABQ8KBS1_9APHY|nr:uncharacterized protein C8Q71DRAFT_859432 [Rhodofomes roseus]KAH9834431.1 hypothetical protein C8Q71DRAFT_859432 [Rhodofomes roseus]